MSRISLDKRMHQQLLDMLGAKDQEDAARIIAGFHAREWKMGGWRINPGHRPVDSMTEVQALWSDGEVIQNRAGNWPWGHAPIAPGAHVIVAYRLVNAKETGHGDDA